MLRLTRVLALALALACGATAARADAPRRLGYQGRLFKADGSPESGTKKITFRIVDAEQGGNELWKEEQTLALSQGAYSTFLGEVTDLPQALFDGSDRFLELVIDGTALTPRQRIGSVAYALEATNAKNVAGGNVDATQVSVGGGVVIDRNGRLAGKAAYKAGPGIDIEASSNQISLKGGCANDQVLKWNGTTWDCANDRNSSVTAGPGLKLQGNTLGLVDGCASGQVLKWSGSSWECADDTNTQVKVGTGSGLAISNNTLSLTKACSAGESLLYDGAAWVCAPVRDYTAGAGIRINGSTIATNLANAGTINQASNPVDWSQLKNVPANLVNGAPAYSAANGVELSGNTFSLPSNCASNQVLKFDGANWKCAADANSAYIAGNGIEIANNTLSLTKECANGQILRWNGAQWGCDNINAYQAGAGLTLTNNTFALPGCPAGQVMKATASGWACGADNDTGSSYGAGDGLALDSANKFSVKYGADGADSGAAKEVARADHQHDGRYYTKAELDARTEAQGGLGYYTGVIGINNTAVDCPEGWTSQDMSALYDTSGWMAMHIGSYGVFMGGLYRDSTTYWSFPNESLYMGGHSSYGIVKLCHKTFRTRGKAHVSILHSGGAANASICPAGYTFLRQQDVRRTNDNYSVSMTNEHGFYIGGVWTWGAGSEEWNNGYHWRWAHSGNTTGYCFRVMGVEEDPATSLGVYPVALGVRNQAACPSTWTYLDTATTFRRTDSDYSWNVFNDNSSMVGGGFYINDGNGRNWGGENYLGVAGGSVGNNNWGGLCMKHFPVVSQPRANVRALKFANCAADELTISKTVVDGGNSIAPQWTVLLRDRYGMYLGHWNDWSYQDRNDGVFHIRWPPNSVDRFCLKMEGVQ